MSLVIGSRVGSFEIVAPLGAGAMGEVYRARDCRLKREVALKLLPAALAGDSDRLARFAREAEVLAALNHPHIAAIYGIEETADATALVLELVEGTTLAARIARGPIPVREAIAIATQIAAAVEAAHDRNIIHRDLKPSNIKLTPDGCVKVLDFGLAKAIDDDQRPAALNASTMTDDGTAAGVVLGTAPYMSPEQARGQPLDTRTDIWAFACVLYEILTGQQAFTGKTTTDILAAVVTTEPKWSALPVGTPPSIVRLLERMLEKDLKRRLRHIGDAKLELEDALTARPSTPAASAGRSLSWTPWLAAGAAVALIGWIAFQSTATRRNVDPLAGVSLERLTYDPGLTTMPAISSDGRLIAYASDRAGRGDLDIWVQLAEGAPLRLTDDPAHDQNPHFSPDGSQIVFRSERTGGGVYVVPALGGTARLIAPEGRNPQFSPDGSRIAYWVGGIRGGSTASSAAYVVALAGGQRVQLLDGFETARDPVWAPDGRSLLITAVAERAAGAGDVDWWWTPVDGGEAVRTGASKLAPVRGALARTERAQWTDAGLIFSDGRDLWTLPISLDRGAPGEPRRITVGGQQYAYPSVSHDGRIVAASTIAHRVIRRVAMSEGEAAVPATLFEDMRDSDGRTSQTADGSRIVFERALLNGREIWMKTLATGNEQLIARVDERGLLSATVSPDGSKVVYTAGRNGFVVDTVGGVPRQLCTNCEPHGFLSDNRRVLSMAANPGDDAIRLRDVITGGSSIVVQTTEGVLNRPHTSPDDRWIAFRQATVGGKTLVAELRFDRPVTIEEAMMVQEPTRSGRPAGWSLDGRTLYLLLDTDGWRCLWGQSVDDNGRLVGPPYPARHFHGLDDTNFGTTFGNAISAGGFLYEGTRRTANLWVLRRQ